MPGPGGGSRGGGFGGSHGGGFGGGFGGGGHHGGFGGPHRPHGYGPRGPHFHFGWGRPFHYGGGGCFGGLMGMLMLPIIMLLFVGIFLFSFVGSAFSNVSNGGTVEYDERKFQTYADARYAEEFGSSTAYEDNLMIVFLSNKECDDYYAIAWVGNNINTEINEMFGNEQTPFGRTTINSVAEYYEFSISANLASVMEKMTDEVVKLGLDSSFKSPSDNSTVVESHISNHTTLNISEETVNMALVEFTEQTDIPVVIVVDTMENVFGKTLNAGDIFIVIIMLVIAVVAVYLIVRAVRQNKANKNNGGNNGGSNDYNNGGGNHYQRSEGRYNR